MKRILLFLLLFCSISIFSQTDSGDLEVYLNALLDSNPDDSGDDYTVPNNTQLTSWENCISSLLAGDIASARTHAGAVNYEIVLYTQTGAPPGVLNYHIVKEKSPATNYWGTYVFPEGLGSPNYLVLQAPHSNHDFNTGKQAIYNFIRLNNYALFLNGAHRCNNSQASTCSGTTSVCSGSSQAFRVSDLAHNTNSAFQKTTELVYDYEPETIFFQLHGFTKLPDDPYVILSNGTDETPTGRDYAVEFMNTLSIEDPSLTFKIAHVDDWTRLVGFTNTQGRYINESPDPCGSSATSTTGRFVHVEQEKTKLRDDSTGWNKVYLTLDAMFNPFIGVEDYIALRFTSKNPFTDSIEFSAEGVKNISLISLTGKELYSSENNSLNTDFLIDTSSLPSGIYILKVITDKGTAAKKLIRE